MSNIIYNENTYKGFGFKTNAKAKMATHATLNKREARMWKSCPSYVYFVREVASLAARATMDRE
jgi:hypothetical protein